MQDMLRDVPQLVGASRNILRFLREATETLLVPALEGVLEATKEAIDRYKPSIVVTNAVADFIVRQLVNHYELATVRLDPYHLADPALGDARILPLVMPSVFPEWVPTLAFRQSHRLFDGIMC